MATYYRWRKSAPEYGTQETNVAGLTNIYIGNGTLYKGSGFTEDGINFKLVDQIQLYPGNATQIPKGSCVWAPSNPSVVYSAEKGWFSVGTDSSGRWKLNTTSAGAVRYSRTVSPGTFQGYVYSTSSSAYPNGGVSGGYYYDQRTTVTSPKAPTGLTYPNPITTPSAAISWTAATSATDYPVSLYEVSYSTNGGSSWTVAGTTAEVSYTFSITPGTTSIMFRVRAKDSNNQWGSYVTGTQSQVILAPDLTVPQMVMQGQPATVNCTAIEGADSYTLQRKSSADAEWTQVYSGANLSYSETVGTWTSLQYRVQAVFDETPGGWATSDPIQIVSASALVISGQDGDLGTLTSDVPYSISSDQTSPTIDVTVEVNGGEYASFQATSGQTYKVGVLDLPTGTGNITITATTTVSESPVTVTRTWTYSKTAQTFPNSGSVATLTKEGNVVYPETLVEAVRASMTPWGGNLSTALELLKRAALFNRTKHPKYSEVTISMANVTEGQIVNIPRGGVMTPHYVGKLEYETSLNGAGRRLLVPLNPYPYAEPWDSGNVNEYANSDIDVWMNSTYKQLFPEEIQTAMGTTEFYYTPGNGNTTVTTLSRSIFLLSVTEFGANTDTIGPLPNVEGTTLPIANLIRIAHLNGIAVWQWTRTPFNGSNSAAFWLTAQTGEYSYGGSGVNTGGGYGLHCFTLPSTFTGTYYVDAAGNIHDQQEYIEAGDWLDVWGNAIPAVKIETGSYVGTGTSGSSNPNTLTFGFEPKILFVSKQDQNLNSVGFFMLACKGVTNAQCMHAAQNTAPQGPFCALNWSENSVSWYNTSGSTEQLNMNNETYFYVAIG